MELGKPNLEVFADTLLALAKQDRDVLVVTGDSRGSGKLAPFGRALPEQIVEVGIAEQNLVGISAGLASAGKKVFAVSPACFLTARALEQIKNDVAYSNNPVKLVGISAGVSYGALGSTHHSLHDFAALQAINNIAIVIPADNFEARKAIEAAVDYPGPIYIRFGKRSLLNLHQPEADFQIGKAITLTDGGLSGRPDDVADITILATGEPAGPALQASQLLAGQGISARVISVHTIRPLDEPTILSAARRSRALLTVEEHRILGGFGSTIATLLMQNGVWIPFRAVGIPDEYTVTGSQAEIFEHYGISPQGLADTSAQLVQANVELMA